jgi:hypothetical protein
MKTELQALLDDCEADIASLRGDFEKAQDTFDKARDALVVAERAREYLLRRMGKPPKQQAPAVDHRNRQAKVIQHGGPRPAGSLVAGSLPARVMDALRQAGKPMRLGEIVGAVSAQGYVFKNKGSPNVAISGALSGKDHLFRKVSSGVYELATAKAEMPSKEPPGGS